MRFGFLLAATLLISSALGCSPTPTPPAKQPEPNLPLVGGLISGLPEDTLVTIHIRTPSGWEAIYGTQRGSGPWEAVATEASGVDYVVTAEAEGYVSQPISYSIHLSGSLA